MDNGYYKGYKIDPIDLDKNIFHKTERSIGDVINLLEMHEKLDEGRFGVLVSYIAQMFVRSPLAGKFIRDSLPTDMLEMVDGLKQKNKENIIRNSIQCNREYLYKMYESKYLKRYKFKILVDDSRRFVLSDMGISPYFLPITGIELPPCVDNLNDMYRIYMSNPDLKYGISYYIPLSSKVLICIVPEDIQESEWNSKNVEYEYLPKSCDEFHVPNVMAIHSAQQFYVSPSEDLINFYSQNGVESNRMDSSIFSHFLFRDYIEDGDSGSFKASLYVNDERAGKEGFQAFDLNMLNKSIKDLLKGSPVERSFAKEWLSNFRNSLLRYIRKLED